MMEIRAEHLTKSYEGRSVLRDVTFTAGAGITRIAGRSGAGKTTLLRILLGLETAESGRVLVPDGCRWAAVFQEDRLLMAKSAGGNLRFALGGAYDTARAAALLEAEGCPLAVCQNRYSMLDRTVEHNGLLAFARGAGKGVAAFSPLAQGLLTNRYLDGIPADSRVHTDGRFLKEKDITPEKIAKIRALNEIAAARGQTLAEMALAWLLSHEEITTVLIGASKTQQILDNIKAVQNMKFTTEELAEIDRISK